MLRKQTKTESFYSQTGPEVPLTTQTTSFKSYFNPHVPQTSEPYEYYIGDIYQRYQALADGKWPGDDHDDGPYLRHIKRLARNGWPQLRYLADFIECSTVPVKHKFLVNEDREERMRRVHVAILDLEPGKDFVKHEFRSDLELEFFMENNPWPDEPGFLRLFVVEDLSSVLIELLGSRFDIDPSFFRAHLCDYQWFNIRDPWFEMPTIHSRSAESSYFTFRHIQPIYLRDQASVTMAKEKIGGFNVLRRIDLDSSSTSWADLKGSTVGLIRSSTSCWTRPKQNAKEGWLGVLLIDPPVNEGQPLWGGYDNIRPPPSLNKPQPSQPNLFKSVMEEFLYWTINMPPEELTTLRSEGTYFFSAIFSSIPAQWLLCYEHMSNRLSLIEWELESEPWRTAVSLDETLNKLHPWRRRITNYGSHIQSSLDIATLHFGRDINSPTSKPHFLILIQNFHALQKRHQILQSKVDKIVSLLTAVISIEESKKAMKNARDVTRITYLAFIYIPLSFVASFLSMDSGFPTGSSTVYWTYFVIAIPLSGLSLLITIFWSRIQHLFDALIAKGEKK